MTHAEALHQLRELLETHNVPILEIWKAFEIITKLAKHEWKVGYNDAMKTVKRDLAEIL